jgi:hypothetical protein
MIARCAISEQILTPSAQLPVSLRNYLARSMQRPSDPVERQMPGNWRRRLCFESLSVQLQARVPSLFDPTAQEVRTALGSLAQGKNFALLARDFFARLTYRSLDYYLSRELALHTGAG